MATRRARPPTAAPDAARLLFECAPQAQALFGADGRLVEANAAWLQRVGHQVSTLDDLAAWLTSATPDATFERIDHGTGDGCTAVFLVEAPRERQTGRGAAAFLARAAHQLRTPIASIYGFSELMVGRRMTPERLVESAQVVHRQSASLVRLIDLLLDLARLEARQGSDFRLEAVDVVSALREAAAELPAGRAPSRIVLPNPAPAALADRSWLRTALRELLDNACAYSPGEEPVTVSVESIGRDRLAVRIADRGRGLTAEQAVRAVERFVRISEPDDPPGHGLGLSLASDIVALMNGRLDLCSAPGGGCLAVITLPTART